jgi:hypothetical protein
MRTDLDERFTALRGTALAGDVEALGAEIVEHAHDIGRLAAALGAMYRSIHAPLGTAAVRAVRENGHVAGEDFRNGWPVSVVDREIAGLLQAHGLAEVLAGNVSGNAWPIFDLAERWPTAPGPRSPLLKGLRRIRRHGSRPAGFALCFLCFEQRCDVEHICLAYLCCQLSLELIHDCREPCRAFDAHVP